MRWLKHAFAIDPPEPAEPTPEQQAPIDWMCSLAARKHLTTPAWMALQICRPLNWVGAMTMHFLSPAVWAITPDRLFKNYRSFAGYLEHRGSIDYMVRRLEHFEAHYQELERQSTQRTDDELPPKSEHSRGRRADGREEA
ncbi:MAG: hypothetical protein JSV91_06750 [Phycisphaerales bacterium]|nr:MAG: hypothetical protein JSV91_06750 [Phycisphaerales bacterium]